MVFAHVSEELVDEPADQGSVSVDPGNQLRDNLLPGKKSLLMDVAKGWR